MIKFLGGKAHLQHVHIHGTSWGAESEWKKTGETWLAASSHFHFEQMCLKSLDRAPETLIRLFICSASKKAAEGLWWNLVQSSLSKPRKYMCVCVFIYLFIYSAGKDWRLSEYRPEQSLYWGIISHISFPLRGSLICPCFLIRSSRCRSHFAWGATLHSPSHSSRHKLVQAGCRLALSHELCFYFPFIIPFGWSGVYKYHITQMLRWWKKS